MSSRTVADFRKSVNMSGSQIRAWAKDPRSRCYSQRATHRRLTKSHRYRGPNKPKATVKIPSLATLADQVARGKVDFHPQVLEYMRAVVNFNKRHGAQARSSGCTEGRAIALRNWGRRQCGLPATCTRKKRDR